MRNNGEIDMNNDEEIISRLNELIPSYKSNKLELDSYTEICEKYNTEIKNLMEKANITEFEVEGIKARRIVSSKKSMNEDMLLKVVKKHGLDVVKTKEYVDMDKLESILYNDEDEALAKDIADCISTKEIVQLKLLNSRKDKRE